MARPAPLLRDPRRRRPPAPPARPRRRPGRRLRARARLCAAERRLVAERRGGRDRRAPGGASQLGRADAERSRFVLFVALFWLLASDVQRAVPARPARAAAARPLGEHPRLGRARGRARRSLGGRADRSRRPSGSTADAWLRARASGGTRRGGAALPVRVAVRPRARRLLPRHSRRRGVPRPRDEWAPTTFPNQLAVLRARARRRSGSSARKPRSAEPVRASGAALHRSSPGSRQFGTSSGSRSSPSWSCRARSTASGPSAPRRSARGSTSRCPSARWSLVVGAFAVAASHPAPWYTRGYPDGAPAAVAASTAGDPRARVFANEAYADWLLWELPSLSGRVAFDARFELLTSRELHSIDALPQPSSEHWLERAAGYRMLVLERATELRAIRPARASRARDGSIATATWQSFSAASEGEPACAGEHCPGARVKPTIVEAPESEPQVAPPSRALGVAGAFASTRARAVGPDRRPRPRRARRVSRR